jgi:hypothetical protein
MRTGSSSRELHLPFRVCSCSRHLPDTRRYRTPPLGSRSPSRRECRVHMVPGSHTRLDPPTVFLTLATAYSSANLVGLFHPTATSGIRSSGVFPAAKPARLIDEAVPSCRFSRSTSHRVAPLVPADLAPTSECHSGQRSVVANRWFRPADHSIPSWAFNSLGLFSVHLGDAFTPPPLMTFPTARSLSTRWLASSVSIGVRPGVLSPDYLPVRASWPSSTAPKHRID